MSILVKDITKIYGSQKALDSVSLTINNGEVVGLLGPNGAGKSTLMKILSCFIPPTSGYAEVDGFNIFDHSLDIRRRLGYLPESNPLYPDMYVREFLEFIAGLHGLGKDTAKRVKEIIEITGLGPEQGKKLGALSKGYRQRAGLAQALIHNPEVLILDEPTSGLDPNQLVEIRKLIQNIGKEKTVILSTHIMQEVEAMCKRVIIIDKGKIVADGSTESLTRNFEGKQIVKVEFDRGIEEQYLRNLDGVLSVKLSGENFWEVEAEAGIDVRSAIFKMAVENELTVLSLSREERKLEGIFRKLTSVKS
jgi:ABC-2 type transport system ATP-binding protein